MKPFLLFTSLILFHFFAFSQINKNTWVGQNNEYLNISKKTATLQKGISFIEFDVVKYVKNNYIILSKTKDSIDYKVKYYIVRLAKDTLILYSEGDDFFELSEPNKQNQYVFVNSMLTYKFVSFYFETSSYNFDNPKEDRYIYILFIDSARNSRVVIKNESFNEGTMYRAPISEIEYERLVKILSSCDLSSFPEADTVIDKKSPYQILEISYNDQVKNIGGTLPDAFADELIYFMCEYIESRANIDVPFGWRVWIRQKRAQ
jgi:PKD repeat protein